MANKISFSKFISQASPEIMFCITQVLAVLSIYNIFFNYCEAWELTVIFTSLFFGFFNLTILFFALRPFKFSFQLVKEKQNSTWRITAFLSIFIYLFIYLSIAISIVVIKTSYGAAQLIILGGTIIPLCITIGLIFAKNSPGLSRKIFNKIQIRFPLMLLFLLIAGGSWHIADWNPALRHYSVEMEVSESNGIEKINAGDTCFADIGAYPKSLKKNKCRVRFFCNGKKLYGSFGSGIISCRVSSGDKVISIRGSENSVSDGDPAFAINSMKKRIRFSQKRSLRYKADITGKMTSVRNFPLYYIPKNSF